MTESAPLLDNIDENVPHIIEAHTTKNTPASDYFRPVFKKLATSVVVISIVTIVLLIATYIILINAPLGNSYPWGARQAASELAILLCAPLVVSGISAFIDFPILLNVVVDVGLLAYIIPRMIEFVVGIRNSSWCQQIRYPGQPIPPPDLTCLHWETIIMLLLGGAFGLCSFICLVYVIQLLLRGIAIFKTKLWRRPLSWALPREITINFSMKVVKQQEESAEGSEHGQVYLA